MTKQQNNGNRRRVAIIQVAPYLAQYARQKFCVDPKTGGIIIPDSFNLYHCVWQLMAKWPLERWHIGVNRRVDTPEGNLTISLPSRRSEGGVTKDPRFWNYLSPRSARVVGRELKRLFDWEFHHYVENLMGYRRDIQKIEAIRRFIKKYSLGIDAEDALLKNYQRHEKKMRIFLGLNKYKSALTSTIGLSCHVPDLLRRPETSDDTRTIFRNIMPLRQPVIEGLEHLGTQNSNKDSEE